MHSSGCRLPERSFRIVCRDEYQASVERLLQDEGYRFEPEPFCPFCYRLLDEPQPLGKSIAALFGYIYIQDRSSMLPPLALDPGSGDAVLDMAASPGSKSGMLSQLVGGNGFVLANEPNSIRLGTLRANLETLNLVQASTCGYEGDKLPLPAGQWPYILLDPPCSGWGTSRKNPLAVKIWQGKRIQPLMHLQRSLLRQAAKLLKPGGRLLYSTCTTNPEENQAQTIYAISELGLCPQPIPPFPGFKTEENNEHGILIDGEASNAQGFYLSLLQKPLEAIYPQSLSCNNENIKFIPKKSLQSPICDPGMLPKGKIGLFNNSVYFLPEQGLAMLPADFRWRGYMLGKYADGHFSPISRLRLTLPASAPCVIIETVPEVRALLNGACYYTGLEDNFASLWLNNLPLACCQIKKGRLILKL